MKFDLARKVRVFNARFEFVEFELHGLFLSLDLHINEALQTPTQVFDLSVASELLDESFKIQELQPRACFGRVQHRLFTYTLS